MSDLRAQLAAAFGRDLPAPEAPAPAAAPDLLSDEAHLGTPWLDRLQQLRRGLPGAPDLAARPKLAQAEQVSNQLSKLLKKAGRARDAQELAELKDAFLARRDKAAWAALKERFAALELSERAYRALKQEGADPLKALARLDAADPTALRAMGHARLRELLG